MNLKKIIGRCLLILALLSLGACLSAGTEVGNPAGNPLPGGPTYNSVKVRDPIITTIYCHENFDYSSFLDMTEVLCYKLWKCGIVDEIDRCMHDLLEEDTEVLPAVYDLENFDTLAELNQGLQDRHLRNNLKILDDCREDLWHSSCPNLDNLDWAEPATWDWLPHSCPGSLEGPVEDFKDGCSSVPYPPLSSF